MRRTITVTISAEGRDKGKSYLITEMDAERAEDWGFRALNAISKAVGGFPDALLDSGLSGIAAIGISAFVRSDWATIKPLIDEMFTCIKMIPVASRPDITRNLVGSDIEEVATRLKLREEVLGLHLDFFKPAVDWILTAVRSRLNRQSMAEAISDAST